MRHPTHIKLLQTAKKLLTKMGWTHGVLARNAAGKEVLFTSPDATCFCLSGAVLRASREEYTDGRYVESVNDHLMDVMMDMKDENHHGLARLKHAGKPLLVPEANDFLGVAFVLELLERAIVEAKSGPPMTALSIPPAQRGSAHHRSLLSFSWR
jgi:hypothetical protein